MSVKVELGELSERIGEYGSAYLLTANTEAKVHLIAVTPVVTDAGIVVGGVGRHSLANLSAVATATLLWPPVVDGGYSLIVDGSASADGDVVTVVPTKSILHRPAPGPDGQRVGNDCVTLPAAEA